MLRKRVGPKAENRLMSLMHDSVLLALNHACHCMILGAEVGVQNVEHAAPVDLLRCVLAATGHPGFTCGPKDLPF